MPVILMNYLMNLKIIKMKLKILCINY